MNSQNMTRAISVSILNWDIFPASLAILTQFYPKHEPDLKSSIPI